MDLEEVLTTRPYSWMNAVLIGLAAHVLVTESLELNTMFLATAVLSLLMWISGNSVPEYMRKTYEYGEPASKLKHLSPLLSVIALSVYFNPLSIAVLALFLVGLGLYSMKVKSKLFGRVSFLFRGISEVSLILLVFVIHDISSFRPEYLIFMAAIYLVTGSRNLVGDLRDVSVDENTLAVYNSYLSKIVAAGLAIPVLLLYPLEVVVPVAVILALTSLYGKERGYIIHRLYIICTMFFISNIIASVIGGIELIILMNIVFVGVLLNFTYDHVPRKLDKVEDDN